MSIVPSKGTQWMLFGMRRNSRGYIEGDVTPPGQAAESAKVAITEAHEVGMACMSGAKSH